MSRLVRVTAGPLFAVVAAACASNPQPGDTGYAYNVSDAYAAEFIVADATYNGSMTLATAVGGMVTGSMSVSSPVTITGNVNGMISADTLTFESNYEIAENGCTGIVTGVGVIDEGGGSVSGTMDVYDACADQTMEGGFDLVR